MRPPCPPNDTAPPGRLYVYECRGTGLPKQEPVHPHFLGIWSEPPYYYLFYSEPDPLFVAEWVNDQGGWTLEGQYDLDYAQWQQLPQGDLEVGPFLVSLTGNRGKTSAEGASRRCLTITLDPGVVFGSGLHPTTRGSLLAIAHGFSSRSAWTALDFGTGTGILALACAACGAKWVLAVDCNPIAVRAALRNAARNRWDDRIYGIAANSLNAVQTHQSALVMNIEWPSLLQVLREHSWTAYPTIIVSGFLSHHEAEVVSRLTRPGSHRLVWRHEEESWPTLIFSAARTNKEEVDGTLEGEPRLV